MKKIIYLLIGVFTLGSCDDFLDTKSPSEYTSDVIFNSVAYAEFALNGIYARLTQGNMYGARLALNYSTNTDIEFVGADNNSYNESSNRGQSNYYANAGQAQMDWGQLYILVARANLLIDGIRKSKQLTGENTEASAIKDAALMRKYLGEALTLRAIAYYDLIRHWGDVPYQPDVVKEDLSNVYLPATDRDEIYDHIINDLLEAENYVPWLGSEQSPERINKGFVKGFIARVALSRGGYSMRNKNGYPIERGSNWEYYYALANQKCKELMESGVHGLNQSFIEVFKKINKHELDINYKENLFEIAFGLGRSGEMGYSIGVRFYTNSKYGYGNNANVVQTNAYYLYMFDPKDLRRDATIAYYKFGDNNQTVKELLATNPLDYNFQKWDQRWMGEKFSNQNLNANGKIGYGINWVMMRYSDVLLMYAETENELNGEPTAGAMNALKQVRRRAFAPEDQFAKVDNYVDNLNSKESFFEALVKERALEFGGEGIRKYDLIRWNLLSAKIQEQRDAIKKMLTLEPPYDHLPSVIYYRYREDGETIDKADMDFHNARDMSGNAAYSKIDWLSGLSTSNKTTYSTRVDLFSSGLDNQVPGRHLYPIYTGSISESRGLLSNAYGY